MSNLSDEEIKKAIALYERVKEGSGDRERVNGDSTNKLRELVDNFLQPSPKFQRGDVVKWKKGLKNRKRPKEDEVAVVIQQLDSPIIQDGRDSGSPYYREPLDLILGVLDDEGDLIVFHYDKRRFEKIT